MKPVRLIALVIVVLVMSPPIDAAPLDDGTDFLYFEVLAPDGARLFTTSLEVAVGCRFLSSDNIFYTIITVSGQKAYTRSDGPDPAMIHAQADGELDITTLQRATASQRNGKVGLYHTHTWESFIPSDGQSLIQGKGGIFDVGDAMAAGFKDRGVQVERSPDIQRDYNSSRRTALQLLQDGCDTIIDIHRDTAPASTYEYEVDGQPATKALIVVGQENPNMAPNKAFAYQLKEKSDAIYPGLVRGIFFGNGIYNQDLWPRSILLEFGSAANLKEEASRSAYAMAGVFTDLLYPPVQDAATPSSPPGQATPKQTGAPTGRALWRTLVGWVALMIVLIGAYLLINEPDWHAVKRRLEKFTKVEFANYLGRLRRK